MKEPILLIKNMVCNQCIQAVKEILIDKDIPYQSVILGKVNLQAPLSNEHEKELTVAFHRLGFEVIKDKRTQVVEQLKSHIATYIQEVSAESILLSRYLQNHLGMEYALLSKLFVESEAITLEKYCIIQKVERVKISIQTQEFTLTEIAHNMHYSSVAHLSLQFKKVTGFTPTAYLLSLKQ